VFYIFQWYIVTDVPKDHNALISAVQKSNALVSAL